MYIYKYILVYLSIYLYLSLKSVQTLMGMWTSDILFSISSSVSTRKLKVIQGVQENSFSIHCKSFIPLISLQEIFKIITVHSLLWAGHFLNDHEQPSTEVGIYNRKQENTLSTKKAIKTKKRKHVLNQESDQEKMKKKTKTVKKKSKKTLLTKKVRFKKNDNG